MINRKICFESDPGLCERVCGEVVCPASLSVFFPTATPDVAVKINAEDTTGRHSPARLDWRSDIRDIA